MMNQAMKRKLDKAECLDVSGCERTSDGYYVLAEFIEGVDYCDAETEQWIWSIGRRLSDGEILASVTTVFYRNPEFECLWLR